MSKRIKDSLILAFAIIGGISTVASILGVSVASVIPLEKTNIFLRIIVYITIVGTAYILLTLIIWFIKGRKYKNSISLQIGKNKVTVKPGDIFQEAGWKVIPVDTTFSTTADDKVISKTSLHGQFLTQHAEIKDLEGIIEKEVSERGLKKKKSRFPLGTTIPYTYEDQTYLLVAMTDLNGQNESHTNMAQYEQTLMFMWKELSRVYAGHDIVLPLMGSGITRFDDDQGESADLLRCMLCTMNTSRVHFKSDITVVLYNRDKLKKLPLYEYKELFKIAR